ncbi:hypothetical protein [Carboxylicivirga linearis]|uniref:Uncharacterized protein n=1 Tax=Carboxylicivirga linearis TaxID=1628157 RepID=A0ABS5K1Y8_9BACT|nr:hypothetical protein [Carboxylicivirga linearis]MBS2101138.1 hypothetical protein [Carboxylicivirga linearis]
MQQIELIKIALSSSVIAGIVSAIVSYFITLKLKKYDFKTEYFKEILKKRLTAYQYIENQIGILKGVVIDDDRKSYHLIFDNGETKFLEYQQNLFIAISYSLWIDDETVKDLEKLNSLFFNLNNHVHDKNNDEIVMIGKEYYQRISDLRFKLENSVKRGLYNLHDVKKAFRTKKKNEKRFVYEE